MYCKATEIVNKMAGLGERSFQKNATFLRSFEKNLAFSAFFYILCKRTLCSLRSFTFFAKECCLLCVLLRSLDKNVKKRIVLLGFISRQKHEKRT